MATQSNPIVLYDIAQTKGQITWSGNVFKTKLLLHYKRLPYRSVYIRAADIGPTLEGLGFEPSWSYKGVPIRTVPSIMDPAPALSAGHTTAPPTLVVESRKIAHYLDSAYPNTPPAFPQKNDPLYEKHESLIAYFTDNVIPAMIPILTPAQCKAVDAESAFAMDQRFSPIFFQDQRLENVFRKPEERGVLWARLKATLDGMAELIDATTSELQSHPPLTTEVERQGSRGSYTFGNKPYYLDIVMMSHFLWSKEIPCDRDPGIGYVWDVIASRNGGRWSRLVGTFEEEFGTQWPRSTIGKLKEDINVPREMETGFAEARL